MLFDLESLNPEDNMNSLFSFGLYPIFKTCIDYIPKTKSDTILVNLYTLIRNQYVKDLPIANIIQKIFLEIEEFSRDMSTLFEDSKIYKPSIVFYCYDYRKSVDPLYIRPLDMIRTFCNITFKLMRPQFIKLQNTSIETTRISFLSLQNIIPVYDALYNSLSLVKNNRKALLVSGMALDYHLLNKDPKIKLLESYTGKILSNTDIPKKVFKKYDKIPFTKASHVLLGDQKLLLPTLGIKKKKQLLELAIKENWSIKTRRFITISIRTHNFELPYKLR